MRKTILATAIFAMSTASQAFWGGPGWGNGLGDGFGDAWGNGSFDFSMRGSARSHAYGRGYGYGYPYYGGYGGGSNVDVQQYTEGTLAIEMGATLEDLMVTIHPHPTLSEALMEAAEVTAGEAVHINPPRKVR